jgi:tRNA (adenine57-N1/adenine58-N1)-methyltransferase
LYKKLKRGPQVITLKDASTISAYTGVGPGDRVLDAGGGSGFLTIYLASLVGSEGKVYCYEIREDFAELVRKNVEKAGFSGRVELKVADVFEKIDETGLDLACLDMASSEKALPNAFAALKAGGYCAGYHPNVEQVKAFVATATELGFDHIISLETIERELLVRPHGCRPATTGLTHTGYVTILRKPKDGARQAAKPEGKSQ